MPEDGRVAIPAEAPSARSQALTGPLRRALLTNLPEHLSKTVLALQRLTVASSARFERGER